jgi:hypothetical protein
VQQDEVIPGFVRTTTRGPRTALITPPQRLHPRSGTRRVAAPPAAHVHRQGHHRVSRLASATSCCVAETMITMSRDGGRHGPRQEWLSSHRRLEDSGGRGRARRNSVRAKRTGLQQPVPVRLLTQLPRQRAGTNAADRARTTRRVEKHDVEVSLVYRRPEDSGGRGRAR